ncbi:DEAD/DEAH box helicase [Salinibacterium hongtaonis]|uniref:DNA/RNA helicase n=1 Tax=Homoserinimonas hongtaonis TaxID=2079791 RepID=A0A2U1T0M0_9MICO|nr:DEAD/DEAH box helicase [Salinibacterium hongtaonis]PWB97323.1 DNA/RNA helicase [Salinibacterium hongtaonis]
MTPPPPSSSWRAALEPLMPVASGSLPRSSGTRPMALQWELREQVSRTSHQWGGPATRTVPAGSVGRRPGADAYRLGVRPVSRSASGNWTRSSLSWSNLPYQGSAAALDPAHHLWFTQFAALHRPIRDVYAGRESDWIYLDDYQSPLLWQLLAGADALGIAFVGGSGASKGATITVAPRATLRLDATLDATVDGDAVVLSPRLGFDGLDCPLGIVATIGDHGAYCAALGREPNITVAPLAPPTVAARATPPAAARVASSDLARMLTAGQSIRIPASGAAEFFSDLYPRLQRSIGITSSNASVSLPELPAAQLVLAASFTPRHTLTLSWFWDYGHDRIPAGPAAHGDAAPSVDPTLEAAVLAVAGPHLTSLATTVLRGIDAAEFTAHSLVALEGMAGVQVERTGKHPDYRELTELPHLSIRTIETEQRDWFDLGVLVTVGDKEIPFGPLFEALARGRRKLLMVDGSYLSLQQPQFERLNELIAESRDLAEWETGPRISRVHASLWSDFEDLADETHEAVAWRAAAQGLLDTTTIPSVPHRLSATLRPYQQQGLDWLIFLYEHGLGGVLADDMGLGKTMQTLGLLAHATAQRGDGPPFLVVAPTSVVPTWVSEAARFAPGLRVAEITTARAASKQTVADVDPSIDVVVTSYGLFRRDIQNYHSREWAGLILDEAQFVKNRLSAVHQCARDLNTPFTLAITGTPLENNLMELWSIFSLVAPGLFASPRRFGEEYARPIESGNKERLARLRRRIRPLMMRRTKDRVAAELPPKQEQVIMVELEAQHRRLYDTALQRERQKLLGLIDDVDRNRMIIFRSLTLLRMLSLDASLVDGAHAGIPSSKLAITIDHLSEAIAEGHRSLVFSQFTSYLSIVAARLEASGIPYVYLDGSTTNRAEVIASFRDGEAPVFLISLKAGGFGLTLTEADYVFLLDPWWNPAAEAQAVDRTHRIGQSHTVMVYRMIAADTIEEKVLALGKKKGELFTSVMDDGAAFSSALTADDIRGLID